MAHSPRILHQGIIIFRHIMVEERTAHDPSDRLKEKVLL
jgi:hypothetical protein